MKNCEQHLADEYPKRYKLLKDAPNPFMMGYEPDQDVSEVLALQEASYFQSLIRIMRWMVELGRVDIATEVSLLSSYMAMPREGHIEATLHIMSYLRKTHNARIVFDPSYPDIDMDFFQ